jgi:hypothetical protein
MAQQRQQGKMKAAAAAAVSGRRSSSWQQHVLQPNGCWVSSRTTFGCMMLTAAAKQRWAKPKQLGRF